jgi:predicted RNase H-like nuclease
MRPGGLQRGPVLPYRPIAGVVPCPAGWLVASAKLQSITVSPEEPQVLKALADVLDYRPSFEIIALHAPVGLLDEERPGGRTCDSQVRHLLGPRRGAAIMSAPSRRLVEHGTVKGTRELEGLSAVSKVLLPRYREVVREILPYRQRSVFEIHPEATFHQLNGDKPLRYSKNTIHGRMERRALLEGAFPGIERVLDARIRGIRQRHLIDAAAALWTTRRIVSRAIVRLPLDPEWDSEGLRMEIVR